MTDRVPPPTGAVTFLFSDIGRSTRLVGDLGPTIDKAILEPRQARREGETLLHDDERLGVESYVGPAALGLILAASTLDDIPDAARWSVRALRSCVEIDDLPSSILGLRGTAFLMLSANHAEAAARGRSMSLEEPVEIATRACAALMARGPTPSLVRGR